MASLTSACVRRSRLLADVTTCQPAAFNTFQHRSNVAAGTRLCTAMRARRTFAASAHRADVATTATDTTVTSASYDLLLRIPSAILDGAHYIGLPWWAAIPASALLVRGTLLYYWSLLPSRKSNVEMARLAPLIHAKHRSIERQREIERVRRIQDEVREKGGTLEEMVQESVAQRRWSNLRRMLGFFLTSRAMRRRFGLPSAFGSGLRSFGVLILMTEGIRAKCGSSAGLLSQFAHTIDQGLGTTAMQHLPQNATVGATSSGASAQAVHSLESASSSVADGAKSVAESGEALSPLTQLYGNMPEQAVVSVNPLHSPFFDPGVLYEGLPWCLDLTAPDPYCLLPGLVFLMYFIRTVLTTPRRTIEIRHGHVDLGGSPGRPSSPYADVIPQEVKTTHPFDLSRASRHLVWGFGIHAALYMFIYVNLPAAITLYLFSSSAITLVQQRWLAMRYPMPTRITPCRRPTQEKAVGTMVMETTNDRSN